MFVHAPTEESLVVHTFILWDDSDLAGHAIELCRNVEQHCDSISFRIEEADARPVAEAQGDNLCQQAQEVDFLLVALAHLTEENLIQYKAWFQKWAEQRNRDSGVLAVLHPTAHLSPAQVHELVQSSLSHSPQMSPYEAEFRDVLSQVAERARVDFVWGLLEADLEQAAREFRFFPPSHPPYQEDSEDSAS